MAAQTVPTSARYIDKLTTVGTCSASSKNEATRTNTGGQTVCFNILGKGIQTSNLTPQQLQGEISVQSGFLCYLKIIVGNQMSSMLYAQVFPTLLLYMHLPCLQAGTFISRNSGFQPFYIFKNGCLLSIRGFSFASPSVFHIKVCLQALTQKISITTNC